MNNSFLKILSCLFLAIILFLSSLYVNNTNLPEQSDKVAHFIMYIFCSASFYFLQFRYYILFSISYGILMEIIQYFIPWRSFSIADIIANSIGAVSFLLILKFLYNKKLL